MCYFVLLAGCTSRTELSRKVEKPSVEEVRRPVLFAPNLPRFQPSPLVYRDACAPTKESAAANRARWANSFHYLAGDCDQFRAPSGRSLVTERLPEPSNGRLVRPVTWIEGTFDHGDSLLNDTYTVRHIDTAENMEYQFQCSAMRVPQRKEQSPYLATGGPDSKCVVFARRKSRLNGVDNLTYSASLSGPLLLPRSREGSIDVRGGRVKLNATGQTQFLSEMRILFINERVDRTLGIRSIQLVVPNGWVSRDGFDGWSGKLEIDMSNGHKLRVENYAQGASSRKCRGARFGSHYKLRIHNEFNQWVELTLDASCGLRDFVTFEGVQFDGKSIQSMDSFAVLPIDDEKVTSYGIYGLRLVPVFGRLAVPDASIREGVFDNGESRVFRN